MKCIAFNRWCKGSTDAIMGTRSAHVKRETADFISGIDIYIFISHEHVPFSSHSPTLIYKTLQLAYFKSERCLHTPDKYSLPWFPHRKQPCDVSDDPGARMRTINRTWLSSKLHPIIIKTKTQTNNPKSPHDTKWRITRTNGPRNCARLQQPQKQRDGGIQTVHLQNQRLTQTIRHTENHKCGNNWRCKKRRKQTGEQTERCDARVRQHHMFHVRRATTIPITLRSTAFRASF